MTGQEMVYPPMDERLATDEQFETSIGRVEVKVVPNVSVGATPAVEASGADRTTGDEMTLG